MYQMNDTLGKISTRLAICFYFSAFRHLSSILIILLITCAHKKVRNTPKVCSSSECFSWWKTQFIGSWLFRGKKVHYVVRSKKQPATLFAAIFHTCWCFKIISTDLVSWLKLEIIWEMGLLVKCICTSLTEEPIIYLAIWHPGDIRETCSEILY